MSTTPDRAELTRALKLLLEHSMLFPVEEKARIIRALGSLATEEIIALGQIMAIELQNNEELDHKLDQIIEENLKNLKSPKMTP